YAPGEAPIETRITIVPAGTIVSEKHGEIFQDAQPGQPELSFTEDERRAMRVLEQGIIYAVFAFFLVGLALNLTPCVYPVIPLTVSYFGGQSSRSRGANFIKALFYLTGIAISFALLGIVSAMAGKQWGFLFQSPWFVVVIASIILLMAASMFGAFEITVPSALLTKLGRSREGIIGALIMGLTVGVIIAPCAAGIIIGLVGLVAKLGLVFKGGLLFFVMGLGLGLPYLLLATFSGLLNRLPQSGMWMVWVKKVFGFLLIAVALYFIIPQIERIYNKLHFLLGILGIVGGLLLGFLDHSGEYSRGFKRFRWIVGILLVVSAAWLTHAAIQSKPTYLPWLHYSNQTVEEITALDKPIFIDFYADWCAPCKQLESETFSDARVVEAFSSFTLIKVDCTKPDATTRAFMERFQVSGLPTLVFLNDQGDEVKDLREIGFVGADKFLASLQTVLERE
ncbi:thioredoxin fold domain-containing protein, partial [candidate division KSB1 bacterium]|nr:thioredoxin fold domain-containing protein [candidate division KSB1 bacterium]